MTVTALPTMVAVKPPLLVFSPDYGRSRLAARGEQFRVVASRPSSLGGRLFRIMDKDGYCAQWYPCHLFDDVTTEM